MDDDVQPQPQPDWQGNPPPAPTGPPPSWDDIKAAPEFAQLNPNEQITAFQHWRGVASDHASSLPGYNQDVQQEFNEASNPEQQRLATAAQQFNTQHPDLPGLVQPPTEAEGFWGTAGRALASGIGPAAGQAAGAELGGVIGAAAGAPEGGVGAIPGAILGAGAGGLGAGLLAESAQKSIMGDEWYNRNRQQMDLNAKAHPYAHQIGTLIPFLVSAFTGAAEAKGVSDLVGKVVSEESPKLARVLGGGAERVITGGLGGARAGALSEVEQKGQITPETVATGAGRGAVTMGAVGIFPAMKTILGQAIKGIPDSYVMATAGEVYDASIEHRPVDFKKISQEGGGGIAPFALQNALLGALHGMPLRARSGEAPPPEAATPTKPEIEAAVIQRRDDLEKQKAQDPATFTKDKQDELDDHTRLIEEQQKLQPPAAPETPAAPTAPEVTAPEVTAPEAVSPEAPKEQAPPITQEELANKINVPPESIARPEENVVQGGIAAGEVPEASPNENVVAKQDKFLDEYAQERGHESYAHMAAADPQEAIKAMQYWKQEFAPKLPTEAAKPTDEQRQAAEAQAKTLSTEILQKRLSEKDKGYHDIIQAELDRRANAGTAAPIPEKPTEPAAPTQTLEERIAAKTEAENAKARSIQEVEDKIPPDKPFPKDLVFKTRDRELAAKQAWLDHVQDPERDFTIQDLQKFGKDAGTKLYKAMWGEGGKTKHTVPLDEARKEITEGAPTQAETPEETERTAPEFIQQPEAPTEEAVTPHEQVLMDHGITDPKAALDRTNEIARKKGLPEKTMQDLAEAMQKAEKMTRQAPTDSGIAAGKTVRTESSVPINPIRVLENTQKLDNIGALDPKDPVGSGLRGLAEKGTAVQKFIAKLLLNSGIDTSKIKLSFDNKMAQKALYEYDGKHGFNIYLNLNSDHSASSIYGALLHEALHHVTVWKLLPGYVPNAHEAVAIQSLDRLLTRGRQAAWKESFGRTGTKEELAEFTKWLNNPNDTTVNLSHDQLFKLYDNYSKFYGLANTKELVAEITNPELVDFLGRLPADTSIKGRALNLLHQARNMIMQLVSGRPVEQQDNIQKYFESVAALTQEAPTHVGKAEIGLRSNAIQQAESAGLSPDEIDRIKKGMIPAGNRFLYSMAPYNVETNRLGDKHTLPKSGEIDETAFAKVGGVNKPLNKAEIALYKTIVPQAFQNGKVNVRTLDQGLRTRGPTVETKKLGRTATDFNSQIGAINEGSRMRHEWFDNLTDKTQTSIANFVREYLHDPDSADTKSWLNQASEDHLGQAGAHTGDDQRFRQQAQRWAELQNIRAPKSTDAKYSFIGPKSEEHMPGYVEGLVRLPSKDIGYYDKAIDEANKVNYRGPHFGAEDRNVLSFYRGYEETLPDGSKAFHVIEVQSDWAQQERNRAEKLKDRLSKISISKPIAGDNYWSLYTADNGHLDYDTEEQAKAAEKKLIEQEHEARDPRQGNHPLLQVYESLALKAAIQHAKEIGASKVILSDAETAMMTEGHDRAYPVRAQVGDWVAGHLGNGDISDAAIVREPDIRVTKEGGGLAGLKEEAEKDDGKRNFKYVQVTPELLAEASKPLQDKGMRLHYDQTLPSAMEKITGQKGEAVDLGPHKSAEPRTSNTAIAYGIDNPKGGSPVFKDAEGNPKTNITGKSYDLVKTPDEFTLTDRLLIAAGLSPEELPKSKGKYAVIMRDAGVPYVGNFLGTHEQMAKDAQDILAKNPNAADERLDFLVKGKAVPSAEDFHLFRAKVSEIRREEVAARVKGDTAAAQAAYAKEQNWMQKVYNKTAEAGKSLQAVQGALDINTGDFFDLRSYFKMVYGKDFTPKQEEQVKQIVQATTEARVETLKNSIKMGQEIVKTAEGTTNELGKAAEGTKLTSAEKKAAKAAGVETKKDPTGKDTGQLEFGFDYDPADAGKKLSQYLNARFEAKPYRIGQKNLTIREVGNIWKFIKANYLDGTEYIRPEELVNDVASDLKIDRRVVQEAISAPKTVRAFEAERYKAQAQQRAIVQATKTFMDNADKGKVLSNLAKLWELPRTIAVVGHVNPALTHAGSLLFRPLSAGREELAAIPQAFRAAFLGGKNEKGVKMDAAAYHEKLMQDVMNADDYAYLTKQGLAAKVGTLEDMGQYNNYLGRIGVAGNRGMDTLKVLRMNVGQKEYKRLQGKDWFKELDQDNKDQVVKEAMSRINSETGTTTPGFTKIGNLLTGDWRTFLFAPRLEGARWQQMVVDPLRATGLFLKGTAATPAERYFRMAVLRRSAEMASTMVAALGVNAAILKAVNSDDKINWFDPTRSDWLAFKVHGQTVLAPSSFLAPLRLSLSVALSHVIPAENRQPYTDKIINYAMGKVTPSISDLVEIARAKQQYTGKPIEALQNLYENMGVKFSTPRNPKDPISLTHWALTKGPIPLAATVEGWSNAMDQQGIEPKLRDTIIGASLALVGSMFAVHQHPTPPEKNTNQ
jgi:hypothetical protein